MPLIASGSDDGQIKLWNIESKTCIRTLRGHNQDVRLILFSNDNSLLFSGSLDKTIKIWDVQTGECLHNLVEHKDCIISIIFNSISKLLCSISYDLCIKIWNVETGICIHTSYGNSASFNSNGELLATCSECGEIKIINLKTFESFNFLDYNIFPNSISFNSDDSLLVINSLTCIKIINVTTYDCLHTIENNMKRLGINKDLTLITSSYDDKIKIWNIQKGECLTTLEEPGEKIISVLFNQDSSLLLVLSKNIEYDDHKVDVLTLWNLKTGQVIRTLSNCFERIFSISFYYNFVFSTSYNRIIIWDSETGDDMDILRGHLDNVRSICCDNEEFGTYI